MSRKDDDGDVLVLTEPGASQGSLCEILGLQGLLCARSTLNGALMVSPASDDYFTIGAKEKLEIFCSCCEACALVQMKHHMNERMVEESTGNDDELSVEISTLSLFQAGRLAVVVLVPSAGSEMGWEEDESNELFALLLLPLFPALVLPFPWRHRYVAMTRV
eukprot:767888-Hanusia_phi.AAC.1